MAAKYGVGKAQKERNAKERKRQRQTRAYKVKRYADMLLDLFVWEQTKQGHVFWQDVQRQLLNVADAIQARDEGWEFKQQ